MWDAAAIATSTVHVWQTLRTEAQHTTHTLEKQKVSQNVFSLKTIDILIQIEHTGAAIRLGDTARALMTIIMMIHAVYSRRGTT
jgi:hypothetical protein